MKIIKAYRFKLLIILLLQIIITFYLLPFYNFNNIKDIDIINERIIKVNDLNLSWREKWLEISEEISRICNDILSLITKDKE